MRFSENLQTPLLVEVLSILLLLFLVYFNSNNVTLPLFTALFLFLFSIEFLEAIYRVLCYSGMNLASQLTHIQSLTTYNIIHIHTSFYIYPDGYENIYIFFNPLLLSVSTFRTITIKKYNRLSIEQNRAYVTYCNILCINNISPFFIIKWPP